MCAISICYFFYCTLTIYSVFEFIGHSRFFIAVLVLRKFRDLIFKGLSYIIAIIADRTKSKSIAGIIYLLNSPFSICRHRHISRCNSILIGRSSLCLVTAQSFYLEGKLIRIDGVASGSIPGSLLYRRYLLIRLSPHMYW